MTLTQSGRISHFERARPFLNRILTLKRNLILLAYLAPVFSFLLINKFSSESYLHLHFGNVSLANINMVMAISLPWIAQVGCLPLYVNLGDHIYKNGFEDLAEALLAGIPVPLLLTAILLSVFMRVLSELFGWAPTATYAFAALSLLHILAFQLMIYESLQKNWSSLILCWVSYSVLAVYFSHYWFLPPLAVIALILRKMTPTLKRRPLPLVGFDSLKNSLHGFFLGFLLWGDKLVSSLHATSPLSIPSSYFISLIPAMVITVYYSAFISRKLEIILGATMRSLSKAKIRLFLKRQHQCQNQYCRSLLRLMIVGSLVLVLCAFIFPTADLCVYDLLNSILLSLGTIMLNGLLTLRRRWQFLFFSMGYFVFVFSLYFLKVPAPKFSQLVFFSSLCAGPFLFFVTLRNWKHPYWSSLERTT